MIDDEYILKKFSTKNNKLNIRAFNKITKEEEIYLYNRFEYIENLKEAIFRIRNNIEVRPTCKICGNNTRFNGKLYLDTCSPECAHKLWSNNMKSTLFKKYGKYWNNIEKQKQTCLEKYGVSSFLKTDDAKNGLIKKYGVDNFSKTDIGKQIIINRLLENSEEYKEKRLQTFRERYNVDNPMQIQSVKDHFAETLDIRQEKEYKTKQKNNSFNKSKPEEECYELLKSVYKDVIRQYRDERYPFNCDFYIPSLDLFIEFNGSQYHNRRPYLGTKEDIKEANELLEKDKKLCKKRDCDHTQYKNIWHCWTIRDPKKRQIAKDNNLNYVEFWNLKEVKEWLNFN